MKSALVFAFAALPLLFSTVRAQCDGCMRPIESRKGPGPLPRPVPPVGPEREAGAMPPANGQTPFAQLAALFKKGKAPAADDFLGYYSGRCFFAGEPSAPYAALLKFDRTDDAAGPLFAGQRQLWYGIAFSVGGPSDQYDYMRYAELGRVERRMDDAHIQPAVGDKGSLLAQEEGKVSRIWLLRKNGANYVAEWRSAGEAQARCYFFKEMHPY